MISFMAGYNPKKFGFVRGNPDVRSYSSPPSIFPSDLLIKCDLLQAGQRTDSYTSRSADGSREYDIGTFIPVRGHRNIILFMSASSIAAQAGNLISINCLCRRDRPEVLWSSMGHRH